MSARANECKFSNASMPDMDKKQAVLSGGLLFLDFIFHTVPITF